MFQVSLPAVVPLDLDPSAPSPPSVSLDGFAGITTAGTFFFREDDDSWHDLETVLSRGLTVGDVAVVDPNREPFHGCLVLVSFDDDPEPDPNSDPELYPGPDPDPNALYVRRIGINPGPPFPYVVLWSESPGGYVVESRDRSYIVRGVVTAAVRSLLPLEPK